MGKTGYRDRSPHDAQSRKRRRYSEDRSRSPGRNGASRGYKHQTRDSPEATSHRHHRRRHHTQDTDAKDKVTVKKELPCQARPLSKTEYEALLPLFARYLEVQKDIYIGEIDEREARGRWKSFVARWNEGSLASGWYDPDMFAKAARDYLDDGAPAPKGQDRRDEDRGRKSEDDGLSEQGKEDAQSQSTILQQVNQNISDEPENEDEDYGPLLPGQGRSHGSSTRQGPVIPNLQDLTLQREQAASDRLSELSQVRLARKADRAEQKARLEELVPRAEPGSRERRLEKKKEVNDKMCAFRDRSPGGEVDDNELMGGGEGDSIAELKRMKTVHQRKKTEREMQREEIQRARTAEREARILEYRQREERKVAAYRELAQQRFG